MSQFGNASESFEERQSKGVNIAEERFKDWCKDSDIKVYRLGFDEKGDRLPQNFYNGLAVALRKLPDFVAVGKTCRVVEVKGTANFKKVDYEGIDQRVAWFGSKLSPLWFVFCLGTSEPIWKTPSEVQALYEAEQDQAWSDGVIYRTLKVK